MKKILIMMMVCVGLTAQAQWWTGTSQKTGLVLCLHLADSACEIYSPLQTMDPIPVSSWSLQEDRLTIECKGIGFKTMVSRNGDSWQGYWKQGLLKEDITFFPTDTLFQLRRPQAPQPPYRFDEEIIITEFTDSQGNKVHLEGTLSYPKGGGIYPCIVLVSGSGQQNRDEELFQHRPFLVLADYLASRGIAVLRYDDRGVGASKGPLDSADTRLFAEDAEAMLHAVKGNKHVDATHLGIGGHSEGGAIAPMVAARNNDVKFVVMLAGQGCTGLDVMVQQNEALFRSRGVSPRLCAIRAACMREIFRDASSLRQKDASPKHIQSIMLRHTEGLTKAEIDSIELRKGMAYTLHQQLELPWMQTFLTLDPAEYLPKVTCPVLALNGENDCQVLCGPNMGRIAELCPNAICTVVVGANHLFQHSPTGSPDEYILIEETFDTEAMEWIADWILSL